MFVAGIAANTPADVVLGYFSQFCCHAKIVGQRSAGKAGGCKDSRIYRGHCILEVGSREAYDRILDYQQHLISGRSLMCSRYLLGTQLFKENAKNNKKRIIVKNVPSSVCQSALAALMEDKFGRIQNIYSFKSERSALTESKVKRKHLSYSIMFESHTSARAAAEQEIINLSESSFCIAQRFRLNNRKFRGMKVGDTIKNSSILTKGALQYGREKGDLRIEIQDPKEESARHSPKAMKHSSSVNRELANLVSPKKRSFSCDEPSDDRIGRRRYEFTQYLILESSRTKPTKKLYQLVRREEAEYLSAFELRNAWWSRNNYRLQFGKSRWL